MKQKFLLLITSAAFLLIFITVAAYTSTFGFSISLEQSDWGTFGDYFGGVLNPVFALCAFLGVLWSLHIQIKQLRQLSVDKKNEEILIVIKDIDMRIAELLNTHVGGVPSPEMGVQKILIHHMVAESEREDAANTSKAYEKFIAIAREAGSMVEAATRELRNQVITQHDFLVRYPQSENGQYAPIISYYILKTSRVARMLDETMKLPVTTSTFFIKARETENKSA